MTQRKAHSPSFNAGYEQVERRLVDIICPWLAPWGECEILHSFTCVVSQTPGGDAHPEELPDLRGSRPYAFGLTNAV